MKHVLLTTEWPTGEAEHHVFLSGNDLWYIVPTAILAILIIWYLTRKKKTN